LVGSTTKDARDTLRAAVTCAVDDETIGRNPVKAVKRTSRRTAKPRRKRQTWTVDDARWFLESAWHKAEALYAAFVLVLVLGLRKGGVLGLAWDHVDLDDAELHIEQQLQRIGRRLVLREVKTDASEAPLPLPVLRVTALAMRPRPSPPSRRSASSANT
jgi:integrase